MKGPLLEREKFGDKLHSKVSSGDDVCIDTHNQGIPFPSLIGRRAHACSDASDRKNLRPLDPRNGYYL